MIFNRKTNTGPYLLIIRASLSIILFITPIVYLTAFPEVWELPKALIFGAGVSVALVTWLLWSLRTKRFQAQFGRFEVALGGVLAAGALSTIFSVHHYSSLWGLVGLQSESFMVLFFSIIFAFLIKQTTTEALIRWYFYLIIGSFALVTVGTIFMIGGAPVFSGHDLGKNFFPVSSSPDVLGILLATMWLIAWSVRLGARQKVFLRILDACLVIFLIGLAVLDRPKAFCLLLGGMVILAIVHWSGKYVRQTHNWLVIGSVSTILFLALPLQSWVELPVNDEVVLPSTTSLTVAVKTIEHLPVFGSGPGTFYYDFVKYRPTSFESSTLGELRFVRPDSGWIQHITSYGLVGTAAVIACLVIAYIGKRRERKINFFKRSPQSELPTKWFLIWLVLGLFLTSGSLVYSVLYWAAVGLAALNTDSTKTQIRTGRTREPVLGVVTFGSFALLILAWYFTIRIWGAPVVITSVNRAIKTTAPIEQVGARLEAALKLDPWNSGYRVKYAEYQLVVLQLTKKTVTAEDAAAVTSNLDKAVELDPRNPAISKRSIQIINQLRSVQPSLAQEMFERFEKLVAQEPNSANNLVEWGKAELIVAQQANSEGKITVDQALVQSALGHLGAALNFKPGDLDSRYHQAIAHELLGDRAVAKGLMRELAIQYPNEADLLYELARQERLDENYDEALRLLNRALELAPQAVVIQTELARAYEAKGDKAKAIEILEAVEKSSPDDASVTDWIKRLRAEVPVE